VVVVSGGVGAGVVVDYGDDNEDDDVIMMIM